jgi:hypothetical protein
MLGRLCFLLE